MDIYRKLRDYIKVEDHVISVIFGDLLSMDCEYHYKDLIYTPTGIDNGDHDYLLDKYVHGVRPAYKIINNKITPYLKIWLSD